MFEHISFDLCTSWDAPLTQVLFDHHLTNCHTASGTVKAHSHKVWQQETTKLALVLRTHPLQQWTDASNQDCGPVRRLPSKSGVLALSVRRYLCNKVIDSSAADRTYLRRLGTKTYVSRLNCANLTSRTPKHELHRRFYVTSTIQSLEARGPPTSQSQLLTLEEAL